MRRRDFIAGVGGAVWPLLAHAQKPGSSRHIGVLIGVGRGDREGQRWYEALVKSLRGLGWRPGDNLHIETRWGGADRSQIEASAKELVAANPEVIVVSTTPGTAAVISTNTHIPIVFSAVSDPIGPGFVSNLARPEKNVTGFMNLEGSIGGKWVELLMEIAPKLSLVAIIYNSVTAGPQFAYYRDSIESGSSSFGVGVHAYAWESTSSLEQAIIAAAEKRSTGLVILPTPHEVAQRNLIVSLANRLRLPAVYPFPFWVREGGLISYGVDLSDLHRRAAIYVDRILKGANPSELPVQLPTKFELVVNVKTATVLGLKVPPTLLARADEVIE
jgi:putative tryptophan/tyrosine transport system substrate-binding protein